MAILYSIKVWDQAISGTGGVTVYTDPALHRTIAQADKFNVSARITQVAGGFPTIGIVLEHSNDGVNWQTKHTFATGSSLTIASVNLRDYSDVGTTIGGGQMRLAITLGGVNSTAFVEVWLCGRSND